MKGRASFHYPSASQPVTLQLNFRQAPYLWDEAFIEANKGDPLRDYSYRLIGTEMEPAKNDFYLASEPYRLNGKISSFRFVVHVLYSTKLPEYLRIPSCGG